MELILAKAPNGSLVPVDQQAMDELAKLKVGQGVRVKVTRMRNYKFHRKLFALLNVAFDAWEPLALEYKGEKVAKNFERFRSDVTVLAGYYEATVNLRGETRLEPKSISFSSMDQDEFEKLYSAVIDVVLQRILTNYTRDDLNNVVEQVLRFS
jgi:hypothetical protein